MSEKVYTDGSTYVIRLFDQDGNKLHEWRGDIGEPAAEKLYRKTFPDDTWSKFHNRYTATLYRETWYLQDDQTRKYYNWHLMRERFVHQLPEGLLETLKTLAL